MAQEVDEEIKRMNAEGKTSREISEELAKRDIFLTWQRVRGRIAFMNRKGPKEGLQIPKDEGKTAEKKSSSSKLESAKIKQPVEPAVESDIPPKILKRIRELEEEGYTPAAISTEIWTETGLVIEEAQIIDAKLNKQKGI
jgi:uncharacterized secreted protein with C-terminal beta-propeller domain